MAKAASTADVGDGAKAVEFYHMAFRHFLEGMEKATEAGDDDDGDGQELEASSVKYFLAFDFCPVDSTRSPGTRQARLALSDHGVTWKPIPGVGPSTGNIPDPIVRDGVWYVYYLVRAPRKVEPKSFRVRWYEIDSVNWSDETGIIVRGTAGEPGVGVDPSLIVDDARNLVPLCLWRDVENRPTGTPPRCAKGETSCVQEYFTAPPGYRATMGPSSP